MPWSSMSRYSEAGIKPDDLRLFIVWHSRHRTAHAVLAVRLDEEWLLLDNMTLILVRAREATHYHSLLRARPRYGRRELKSLLSAQERWRLAAEYGHAGHLFSLSFPRAEVAEPRRHPSPPGFFRRQNGRPPPTRLHG